MSEQQMTREQMIAQLSLHGEDAGSDFNDGVEPNGWFGWSIEGDRLTVTFTPDSEDDPDERPTVTREWQLVPVIGDDE